MNQLKILKINKTNLIVDRRSASSGPMMDEVIGITFNYYENPLIKRKFHYFRTLMLLYCLFC